MLHLAISVMLLKKMHSQQQATRVLRYINKSYAVAFTVKTSQKTLISSWNKHFTYLGCCFFFKDYNLNRQFKNNKKSQLAWERLGAHLEELVEVSGERSVWISSLKLLPPRPDLDKWQKMKQN